MNNFILLLQKRVHPYEYMDDWETLSKTSLPKQEDFYCHLNMEDITYADCTHAKACKVKNLEKYFLNIQSDALLLADFFENFRNMCLEINKLDPARFFTPPGLTRQVAFKKTRVKKAKVKLNLLADIDMLLTI